MDEIVKKCATCFYGKYRADKNVWRCINTKSPNCESSNESTHVCPFWKDHREAFTTHTNYKSNLIPSKSCLNCLRGRFLPTNQLVKCKLDGRTHPNNDLCVKFLWK